MSLRLSAALFLLIIPAAPLLAATPLSPAESTALLLQLHDEHVKQPDFQATFTQQRTSHLLNKPVTSEGTVYFSVIAPEWPAIKTALEAKIMVK